MRSSDERGRRRLQSHEVLRGVREARAQAPPHPEGRVGKARMDDRDFDAIEAGSFRPSRATPQVDRAFRGLAVRAPREARFDPRADVRRLEPPLRVILAGVYHFESTYLGLREEFLPRIVLVAVDAATHRASAAR